MEITVRKLKSMPTMDGVAVYCEVLADGKMIGIAHDEGNGGELNFQPHPQTDAVRNKIKELEAHISTLPKIDFNKDKIDSDKPLFMQPTLELFIDEAINKELMKKATKKFDKDCKKGIVCGRNASIYSLVHWTNQTMASLSKLPQGKEVVQSRLDGIKQKGENILNAEYLRSLGWKV